MAIIAKLISKDDEMLGGSLFSEPGWQFSFGDPI
jgi:hypothetical protein